jgi:hypothetical protein
VIHCLSLEKHKLEIAAVLLHPGEDDEEEGKKRPNRGLHSPVIHGIMKLNRRLLCLNRESIESRADMNSALPACNGKAR